MSLSDKAITALDEWFKDNLDHPAVLHVSASKFKGKTIADRSISFKMSRQKQAFNEDMLNRRRRKRMQNEIDEMERKLGELLKVDEDKRTDEDKKEIKRLQGEIHVPYGRREDSIFTNLYNAAEPKTEIIDGVRYEVWYIAKSLGQICDDTGYSSRIPLRAAITNLKKLGLIYEVFKGRPGYVSVYVILNQPKNGNS